MNALRLIVIALLVVIAQQRSAAQLPPMHHIAASTGLINNVVYQIDQDAFGRIWLGTEGGVGIFDGSNFINYSVSNGMSSNTVVGFGASSSGGMFVMHYARGLDYIHPNGTISNHPGFNFPCSFGMIVDSAAFLLRMPSNVILQSPLPLNTKLNESQCPIMLRERQVISRSSGLALFCSEHTVSKATGKGIEILYNSEIPLFAATTDRMGELWVLQADGLLNCATNQKILLHNIDPKTVTSLLLDPLQRAWVVADGKLHYDPGDGVLVNLSASLGLENNTTNSIFRDRDGNIWAATSGKGAYCFYSPHITTYGGDAGIINNTVTAVEPGPNQSILFGTRAGLSVLDGLGIFHNSLLKPYIYTIQHFRGKNIICSALLYTQSESVNGIPSEWLPKSCQLTDDQFSYRSSLDRIIRINQRGDQLEVDLHSRSFMASDRVEVMRIDAQGQLWVGARSGLYLIDSDFKNIKRLNSEFTLLENHIHDIFFSNSSNDILVAADGGIFRKDEKGWSVLASDKASWEVVFSIQQDQQGIIWIATDKGVYGLAGDRIVANFNLKNGLSGFRVLDIWLDDAAEVLWAGTDDGITRIDLAGWKSNPRKAINTLIKSIAETPVAPSDSLTVELAVDQTAFNIRFHAVNFDEPSMITYAYWFDSGTDTLFSEEPTVFVQGLSYGTHDFYVEARKHGIVAGPPAHVRFFIPTPYYLQLWFIFMMTVLCGGLISLGIRLRFNALALRTRRKLKVKEQLIQLRQQALASSINPHFIFNALNSIQYLVGENENDKAHDYIAKLGKLIRANLDSMRNGMTTIDQEVVRLRHYFELEQLRVGKGIQLTIDVPESFKSYRIPVMILQPFVENSIWHGLAVKETGGEIHVTFRVDEFNALIIQIEDDGIGIRKASENKRPGHQSIGIKHIAERLDMLNKREDGSVHYSDLSDEGSHGTRVVLTLYPGCYEA